MSDEQEQGLWRERANFWRLATELAASRSVIEGHEPGPESEIFRLIVKSHILTGLTTGIYYNPDMETVEDPLDKLFEIDPDSMIPWSVAVEEAARYEIDANEILRDYVRSAQDGLQRALSIAGVRMEMMSPLFGGVPISQEMAQQIMRGEFGEAFGDQFADKYLAHVMHGNRPCQHPYDSLDEAIEGVAFDLQTGTITAASNITLNGNRVIAEEELKRRIAEIGSAGLN